VFVYVIKAKVGLA